MLVYGDAWEQAELGVLTAALRARVELVRSAAAAGREVTSPLRELLVLSGQLEQAVADDAESCPGGGSPAEQAHAATRAAAAAFHADWAARCEARAAAGRPADRGRDAIRDALQSMAAALARIPPSTRRVHVRSPEGFARYAVYPEQYAGAAARWLAGRSPGRAVVLGLRSIGTALSALVGAALEAAGWDVRVFTARPAGPPFARTVALPFREGAAGAHGLVVDEGPGMSGSSMAAAAMALVGAGVALSRITLFPSHGGEPGPCAPDAARALWCAVDRCVIPLAEVHLAGHRLEHALARGVEELLGGGDPIIEIADVSAGRWRAVAYGRGRVWPPACAAFARPKYLARARSGARVLLRFGGLTGEHHFTTTAAGEMAARQATRAAQGFSPAPLGVVHGFVATPWIDGVPLRPGAARHDRALLAVLGRYLASAAGPPLSSDEEAESMARLSEMLCANALEALGEGAAARARACAAAAARASRRRGPRPAPAAGDGRLAPGTWIRDRGGTLWKVSCGGQERNHTLAGRQPASWDLAGALVEWRLDPSESAALIDALTAAGAPETERASLSFYRAAYAALRIGVCALCAQASPGDPEERARLASALGSYRRALARALRG